MSSGSPSRRTGIIAAACSGVIGIMCLVSSYITVPAIEAGGMLFTVMPSGLSSSASVLVRAITPPFEAE